MRNEKVSYRDVYDREYMISRGTKNTVQKLNEMLDGYRRDLVVWEAQEVYIFSLLDTLYVDHSIAVSKLDALYDEGITVPSELIDIRNELELKVKELQRRGRLAMLIVPTLKKEITSIKKRILNLLEASVESETN